MTKWLQSPLNKLYVMIIISTLIFLAIVIAANHYFFLQERRKSSFAELERITISLAAQYPYASFTELAMFPTQLNEVNSPEIKAINEALQPIVEGIGRSHVNIEMGYYSLNHTRVVAYAPDFYMDKPLPLDFFRILELALETGAIQRGEASNPVLWSEKPIYYVVAPLYYKGKIIGFSFASQNAENLYNEAFMRTGFLTLATLMLSGSFFIVTSLGFKRLKYGLHAFATSIANGRVSGYYSEFPELEPILNLIKSQTKDMARLDRLNLVGEMAASIGHEVRNPLTTVRGFLQHLSAKPNQRNYHNQFTLMIDELDRANSIITEFLSLAKNRAVNVETVDINHVIHELQPLLEADALHANCSIEFYLLEDGIVLIDQKELRQMLLNFVRNAFEAMPNGGRVILQTYLEGDQFILSVEDQGCGITPEVLDKVGTPFVTTKENGTGLGLAVCYRIANRHNAVISINSQISKGTAVKVRFKQMSSHSTVS